MRVLPSRSLMRFLDFAILALAVLPLGCGLAFPLVGAALATSGGGGGRSQSVRFTVTSNVGLSNAEFVGLSGINVGPPEVLQISPNEYRVTMGLNDLPDGEYVHFTVRVPNGLLLANGQDFTIRDVAFYPVPPSQIPPGPPPPVAGPRFLWRNDTALGVVLEIQNLNQAPMQIVVEGAESAVVFDPAQIHYDGLTGVPWQLLAGGTIAPMQATTIDLPDQAAGAAVLLRYSSSVLSLQQKGAYQFELTGSPVPVTDATWGSIKALYRD
jgi:hypothetical protein